MIRSSCLSTPLPPPFAVVKRETGEVFPQDPTVQLWTAIDAVFRSWDPPPVWRSGGPTPSVWSRNMVVFPVVFWGGGAWLTD